MVKIFSLILCLLLSVAPAAAALAEDCFVINVDSLDLNRLSDSNYVASHLSAQTDGVRVTKYISDSNELAAQVRLTVTQAETSTVVFDKNYGFVSGTFDSGNLYLPFVDNNVIPYQITLTVENWIYSLPFMHLQPRLVGNNACTLGVRLADYNPALTGSWVMGTMLDLDALRADGAKTLPLCASNLYIIGNADLTLLDNHLTVSLWFFPDANVELQSVAVYLIGDVSALRSANPARIALTSYATDQPINTSNLATALLYVPITLSYDPSSLSEFSYSLTSADTVDQLALWQRNLQMAQAGPERAVGVDGSSSEDTDVITVFGVSP